MTSRTEHSPRDFDWDRSGFQNFSGGTGSGGGEQCVGTDRFWGPVEVRLGQAFPCTCRRRDTRMLELPISSS